MRSCGRFGPAIEDSTPARSSDKVSVNTAAIARPELLAELSRQFGSQCIVLSVDARTVPAGTVITEADLAVVRPQSIEGPEAYYEWLGRVAPRSFGAGDEITWT